MVLGFAVLLVGAGAAAIRFKPFSTCNPTDFRVEGDEFLAVNPGGEPCWVKTFPGLKPDAYRSTIDPASGFSVSPRLYRFADVDSDGENELLIVLSRTSFADEQRIYCFESDGAEKWSFTFGRDMVLRDGFGERRVVRNLFYAGPFELVVSGDASYVVGLGELGELYVSQVVLLDPETGSLLDEYWHPGRFTSFKITDLNGDGAKEALLGGVNNPGPGVGHPALVVLDIPFSESGENRFENFFGAENRKELLYALLPVPDVYRAKAVVSMIMSILEIGDTYRVPVHAPVFHGGFALILDRGLKLLHVNVEDYLRQSHAELSFAGGLDHLLTLDEEASWARMLILPTAPDGNSPEIERLFREAPDCDESGTIPCLQNPSGP